MIAKKLVKEKDRLDFLPQYLGNNFLQYEALVYGFMDKFCTEYSGGYWNFYKLDNGGFYIEYDGPETFSVVNDMNYFEGKMSAESVSIAVNIFALNALMDENCDQRVIDYYYALRDFASEHKESAQIFGLID